jgi:hypothetical protein
MDQNELRQELERELLNQESVAREHKRKSLAEIQQKVFIAYFYF